MLRYYCIITEEREFITNQSFLKLISSNTFIGESFVSHLKNVDAVPTANVSAFPNMLLCT